MVGRRLIGRVGHWQTSSSGGSEGNFRLVRAELWHFCEHGGRESTTMQPSGLVLLGTFSASMLQYLAASVNSASTSCPLGKIPMAPRGSKETPDRTGFSVAPRPARSRHAPFPEAFPKFLNALRWTCAGTPVTRTASRRNVAFFPLLSMRWTRFGLIHERAGDRNAGKATTRPEVDPHSRLRRQGDELK